MVTPHIPKIHTAGILQWQAYRILEDELDRALTTHKISAPEWKSLGIIFDAQKDGIRSLQIARKLGVKPPLVTRILERLETKKLVSIKMVKEDKRVRMVHMTKKGKIIFKEASDSVEKCMQKILFGINTQDILAYKKVLQKILDNK